MYITQDHGRLMSDIPAISWDLCIRKVFTSKPIHNTFSINDPSYRYSPHSAEFYFRFPLYHRGQSLSCADNRGRQHTYSLSAHPLSVPRDKQQGAVAVICCGRLSHVCIYKTNFSPHNIWMPLAQQANCALWFMLFGMWSNLSTRFIL